MISPAGSSRHRAIKVANSFIPTYLSPLKDSFIAAWAPTQPEMAQTGSKLRLIQKILRQKILEKMKMDDVKQKKKIL